MLEVKRIGTKLLLASSLWLLASLVPGSVSAQSGRMYFSPASTSVNVGQSFDVKVIFDTDGAEAGGVGARLLYDPAYFEARKVTPSDVFADYPLAAYDNVIGLVSISGVVASRDQLVTGTYELATVNFVSKAPGNESIRFEFTPGSTRDSNIAVMFGNGDILATVDNLSVQVNPAAAGTVAETSGSEEAVEESTSEEVDGGGEATGGFVSNVLDSALSLLGLGSNKTKSVDSTSSNNTNVTSGNRESTTTNEGSGEEASVALDETVDVGEVDPYAPITRQEPITEAYRIQQPVEGTDVVAETGGVNIVKWIVRVIILLALLGLVIWLYKKKGGGGGGKRKPRSFRPTTKTNQSVNSQTPSVMAQPRPRQGL